MALAISEFLFGIMNILFLCTGNSCRSQMAEGWARQLAGDRFTIQSASMDATGMNPRAIAVMAEAGIDISAPEPGLFAAEMLQKADVVVMLGADADQRWPVIAAGKKKFHWPLYDPAQTTGSDKKIMSQYRACRDEISERVVDLLQDLLRPSRRKATKKPPAKKAIRKTQRKSSTL